MPPGIIENHGGFCFAIANADSRQRRRRKRSGALLGFDSGHEAPPDDRAEG
jgi:hypothetical protein